MVYAEILNYQKWWNCPINNFDIWMFGSWFEFLQKYSNQTSLKEIRNY